MVAAGSPLRRTKKESLSQPVIVVYYTFSPLSCNLFLFVSFRRRALSVAAWSAGGAVASSPNLKCCVRSGFVSVIRCFVSIVTRCPVSILVYFVFFEPPSFSVAQWTERDRSCSLSLGATCFVSGRRLALCIWWWLEMCSVSSSQFKVLLASLRHRVAGPQKGSRPISRSGTCPQCLVSVPLPCTRFN